MRFDWQIFLFSSCMNFKVIIYESTSSKRIVAYKSHCVTLALLRGKVVQSDLISCCPSLHIRYLQGRKQRQQANLESGVKV